MPEPVCPMEVPHMPKLGTEVCGHADPVTSISDEGRAENRIDLPVLALHLRCVFKAAASEDHRLSRPHCFRSAAVVEPHTGDRPIVIRNETFRRDTEPRFYTALGDVVL